MKTYSINLTGLPQEEIQADSLTVLQALTHLKVKGLDRTVAAKVNGELDLIDEKMRDAIIQAAQEVIDGKLDDQFPVDIFQTGSGTSSNMNTNEVIANKATELLGGKI